MFLLTLLISIPTLAIILLTSYHNINSVNYGSNVINNSIQTTDKVKEIINSDEETKEITVKKIGNNLNAFQKREAQNISPIQSLDVYDGNVFLAYPNVISKVLWSGLVKLDYKGNVNFADTNILFLGSNSNLTELAFSENVFNSSAVLNVNISSKIRSTKNEFRSNALIIVNLFIPLIEFQCDEYQKNLWMQIFDNVAEVVVKDTIFHSNFNILGNLSNLKIESSAFANNSQLMISDPMDKLTFRCMRKIPVINIKTHLTELHLVDIFYLNFNSKMHPNIDNITAQFQMDVHPYNYKYMLSVKNKPTLILSNIDTQQNANIKYCDKEIKQIMIVDNKYKAFNFYGYSSLETLYLHIEDSHIIIPPSLKKVYIAHQFLRAKLYTSSMRDDIEIIHERIFSNNLHSAVTSKVNCHSKSRLHRHVNLHCSKTQLIKLEGKPCASSAQ